MFVLNALPFIVVIILMSIGYHDLVYPQKPVIPGFRLWFLIGGFFLYMMLWNAYDKMRQGQRSKPPRALGLLWFGFSVRNPMLAGCLVPFLRLTFLFVLMNGLSFLLQIMRK